MGSQQVNLAQGTPQEVVGSRDQVHQSQEQQVQEDGLSMESAFACR